PLPCLVYRRILRCLHPARSYVPTPARARRDEARRRTGAVPMTTTASPLIAHMEGLRWKGFINPIGEREFESTNGQHQVCISPAGDYWALGSFTDGDIETENGWIAIARFE